MEKQRVLATPHIAHGVTLYSAILGNPYMNLRAADYHCPPDPCRLCSQCEDRFYSLHEIQGCPKK